MKELEGFTRICKLSDLKEKLGKRFFVDDIDIAVFKVDGNVYALSNICPHQKTHLIYDGYVENGTVFCPAHGWQFELATGRFVGGIKGLDSYMVKIIADNVYVKVFKKELLW
jgi:3-phenylpropionate/trans-cinnamate dioxygenase ferredoxin subunit